MKKKIIDEYSEGAIIEIDKETQYTAILGLELRQDP